MFSDVSSNNGRQKKTKLGFRFHGSNRTRSVSSGAKSERGQKNGQQKSGAHLWTLPNFNTKKKKESTRKIK